MHLDLVSTKVNVFLKVSAKIEMIVANSLNKMLSKLVPPLIVIDVNVMVTSQLSVVVKLRSPSLTEFSL